jgi:Secretion system C-terminal sorting domain
MKKIITILALAVLSTGSLCSQHYVQNTFLPPGDPQEFWFTDGITINDFTGQVAIVSSTSDYATSSGYTLMEYDQIGGTIVQARYISVGSTLSVPSGVTSLNGDYFIPGTFYGIPQQIGLTKFNMGTGASSVKLMEIPGLSTPVVTGITTDNLGKIFITGYGATTTGTGQTEIFVARFDATTMNLDWLSVLQNSSYHEFSKNICYFPATGSGILYIGATTLRLPPNGVKGLVIQLDAATGSIAGGATQPKRYNYLPSTMDQQSFYVKRNGSDLIIAGSSAGASGNGPMIVGRINPSNLMPFGPPGLLPRYYDPSAYSMTDEFNFMTIGTTKSICLSGGVASSTSSGVAHLFYDMVGAPVSGKLYTEVASHFDNCISPSNDIFAYSMTSATQLKRFKTSSGSALTLNCEVPMALTPITAPGLATPVHPMGSIDVTALAVISSPISSITPKNLASFSICFNPLRIAPSNTEAVGSVTTNLYPNPASDKATISFSEESVVSQISVYDLSGRVMLSEANFAGTSFEFNTREWTSGLYLIQLTYANGKTESMKLMKE